VSTDFLISNGLHEYHGYEPLSKWDGVKVRATDFPQKMKLARAKTELSQKKVADALKMTRSTLAKYELGQLQPDIETLAKITLYYNVKADWLLGLSEDQEFVRTASRPEEASPQTDNPIKKDRRIRAAS
jgi:transcriptional regulator with XRE-family HTH domain